MNGFVHSVQSLGTVDGPGVRSVVFLSGCPLRCVYCHNPDTWRREDGEEIAAEALVEKLLRFYPYIKNGGVTFSGGEPCLQAAFVAECAVHLRARGLHVALDTCGNVWNSEVERMLASVDLVLLDLKYPTQEGYARYTGGSLQKTMDFLARLEERQIPVWIRQVQVPTQNDSEEDLCLTAELLRPFRCIERVELLPFRKLCLEKYKNLGIRFAAEEIPAADVAKTKEAEAFLRRLLFE